MIMAMIVAMIVAYLRPKMAKTGSGKRQNGRQILYSSHNYTYKGPKAEPYTGCCIFRFAVFF